MLQFRHFFTFIFLILSIALSAQSTVKGTLTEAETGEPLIGGYLKFTTPADTNFYFGVSNYDGNFSIDVPKDGHYTIEVSYIGYEKLQKTVPINGDTDLGVISLKTSGMDLAEVQVVAKQARVTQRGDTTSYNADAYGTNPNAAAEDLLQKMPGFVETDGKMQVQGENITKILVNGKPFFGDDPDMALKNLPAEVIDRIEVYGQSEDDEENEESGDDEPKTINIILKDNYNNGTFGNLYAGYGYENKYKAGGNVSIFKGNQRINLIGQTNNINQQNFSSADLLGVTAQRNKKGGVSSQNFLVPQKGGINTTNAFGMNYQNYWGNKVELSGSYFFNQSENVNTTIQTREFFNRSTPFLIDETTDDNSTNINHRANFRLKYKINDKNTILVIPALTIQQNEGLSEGFTQTISDSLITNTLTDIFNSNLSAIYFSNRFVYSHNFEKRKRKLNIQLRNNVRMSQGNTFTKATNLNTTTSETTVLDQHSILDNLNQSYSFSIRYTEPIHKKGTLAVGYTYGNQQNNAEILTSTFNAISEDYDLIEENLSSQFNNDYQSQTGELRYHYRKRKIDFMAQGSYQLATLDNYQIYPETATTNKTFRNFLPNISLRYNISKSKNLRFSLRGRTKLPKAEDLQNVINNSNSLRVTSGNPDLNQQYTTTFDVRYSANNSDKATVFYAFFRSNIANDYISRNTIIATATDTIQGIVLQENAQFRTPINLSGYFDNRFFMTYGIPLTKLKSNFNINIGANYRRVPSQMDNVTIFTNTERVTTGLVLSSNISENIDFTIKTRSQVDFAQSDIFENTQIFNQRTQAKINYIFGEHWQINSSIVHRHYNTFGGKPIDDFFSWNASFGYKFLKDNRGELSVTLYDILNSNVSISQFYNTNSYTQRESLALQRFFMLNFRYNIRDFG